VSDETLLGSVFIETPCRCNLSCHEAKTQVSATSTAVALQSATFIVPYQTIWSRQTGRWWVGWNILFSEKGEAQTAQSPPRWTKCNSPCTHRWPVYQSPYCCIMARCCAVFNGNRVKARVSLHYCLSVDDTDKFHQVALFRKIIGPRQLVDICLAPGDE